MAGAHGGGRAGDPSLFLQRRKRTLDFHAAIPVTDLRCRGIRLRGTPGRGGARHIPGRFKFGNGGNAGRGTGLPGRRRGRGIRRRRHRHGRSGQRQFGRRMNDNGWLDRLPINRRGRRQRFVDGDDAKAGRFRHHRHGRSGDIVRLPGGRTIGRSGQHFRGPHGRTLVDRPRGDPAAITIAAGNGYAESKRNGNYRQKNRFCRHNKHLSPPRNYICACNAVLGAAIAVERQRRMLT